MKCFADITDTEENSLFCNDFEDQEEYEANGYSHCDAAQYEFYLHDVAHEREKEISSQEQSSFD